jgi:hypothetical protein
MSEFLDFLYCIGCEFDLTSDDMKTLCRAFGIDFNDLQQHSGPKS